MSGDEVRSKVVEVAPTRLGPVKSWANNVPLSGRIGRGVDEGGDTAGGPGIIC